ncbi:MAG: DNA alkylation repair protein [Bacillota bacterium]|nr:DNA alkylation repair protein [Bacillota bacterium]
MIYTNILDLLNKNSDESYKAFNKKIIPDMGEAFGVRTPILRNICQGILKNKNLNEIITELHKGKMFEEKLLEGMLIGSMKFQDSNEMVIAIDNYITRIDNWALCDSFVSSLKKLVIKNKELFYYKINDYVKSVNPWEIRFGLILLNGYFKDKDYVTHILDIISTIDNNHYYVKMGEAWLLSTIYLSDSERVIEFLQSTTIDNWCVNKAIQKIIESKRVSKEEKEFIRTLKRYKGNK